ncbi:glycosyltransferase family 4 protein [Flammeovirga sp. MY04]|uniref:glycosyltransferase n=1 Tax=Flammeovirga sp. MY04 TaxID=1191459 RepID=UPI000806344C|nr:glycosyltransferase [Flammeovirga sp. MY04]ANQ47622.1 glycosyltransferase family 4 protein [Flammeovirga sp. MY04]
MEKKKILRIIARLNVGGPAIHTSILSEQFKNNEFDTLLVAGKVPDNEGDMSYIAKDRGVEVTYLNTLQRELSPFNDIKSVLEIRKIIKEYQPDIVHTHTAKAGFVGRAAVILSNFFSRKKIKSVHTFHGHVFNGYFSPLKTKVFLLIERTLAKFTDVIVTITDKQQKEILSLGIGKESQHQMIPLGLDLEKFYHNSEKNYLFDQYNIKKDIKLVGVIARFTQIKNLKLFIDTAKIILNTRNDIHFFMVGDGEDRSILEDHVKELNLEKNITFTGFLKDLPAVYSSLDLVLLTSNNEGSPVSIIEAMTNGKVVASTAVGGVPDLFTDFGKKYLVNKNDANALAVAALSLLGDTSTYERFIEEHQDPTYKKYNYSRLVSDLTKTYKELT